MKPFLIVCGLVREAKLVSSQPPAIMSCADCARLRAELRHTDPSPYSGIVSFGLAGGLCPDLIPGDLVLGRRALTPGASFECSAKFTKAIGERLEAAGVPFRLGDVAGVETILSSPDDKKLFRSKTRALACDMESHIAGEYALRVRLPFAIVRAVSDPAERALPALAARAIGADGETNLRLVLLELMRNPRMLKPLVAAGRDSSAAFKTLARAGRVFGKI